MRLAHVHKLQLSYYTKEGDAVTGTLATDANSLRLHLEASRWLEDLRPKQAVAGVVSKLVQDFIKLSSLNDLQLSNNY